MGENFSLALTNFGEVYSWGLNFKGQLGQSDFLKRADPTLINIDIKMKEIHAGYENACAIDQKK